MNETQKDINPSPDETPQLPDIPLPIEELPSEPTRGNKRVSRVAGKIAASTAAAFSAFTLASPPPVQAGGPEGRKQNIPEDIQPGGGGQHADESLAAKRVLLGSQHNVRSTEKESVADNALVYTKKFFEQIKNGAASSYEGGAGKNTPPLMVFNGYAILDDQVEFYRYIDPSLGDKYKIPLEEKSLERAGIWGYGKGKHVGMGRQLLKWDGKHLWMGVSMNSAGNNVGEDGQPTGKLDGRGDLQPINQAVDPEAWRWVVYDPKHIQLLYSASAAESPHKTLQPFLAVKAEIANSKNGAQLTRAGHYNNFVPVDGWPLLDNSSLIANWAGKAHKLTDKQGHPIIKYDYAVCDGVEYMDSYSLQLNFFSIKPRPKPFRMPSNPTTLKSLMNKYARQ